MNQPDGSDPRELYYLLLRWEMRKVRRVARQITERINRVLGQTYRSSSERPSSAGPPDRQPKDR